MKLEEIRKLIEARSVVHGDSPEYVPLTLKLAGVQTAYFEKLLDVAEAARVSRPADCGEKCSLCCFDCRDVDWRLSKALETLEAE